MPGTQRARALLASEDPPNPPAANPAGSAFTEWGVFEVGKVPPADPEDTVVPQRERLRSREVEAAAGSAARR